MPVIEAQNLAVYSVYEVVGDIQVSHVLVINWCPRFLAGVDCSARYYLIKIRYRRCADPKWRAGQLLELLVYWALSRFIAELLDSWLRSLQILSGWPNSLSRGKTFDNFGTKSTSSVRSSGSSVK